MYTYAIHTYQNSGAAFTSILRYKEQEHIHKNSYLSYHIFLGRIFDGNTRHATIQPRPSLIQLWVCPWRVAPIRQSLLFRHLLHCFVTSGMLIDMYNFPLLHPRPLYGGVELGICFKLQVFARFLLNGCPVHGDECFPVDVDVVVSG